MPRIPWERRQVSRRRKRPTRSPARRRPAECPIVRRSPVDWWDVVVLVLVHVPAGVACPVCRPGTVHEVEVHHEVWMADDDGL